MIKQGDIFWVETDEPDGPRPGVVIQNNAMNESRIQTAVVCLLTGTLKRASAPGNVLLEAGEANLPTRSVVNVSQLYTIHRRFLIDRIGQLSESRTRQVIRGVVQIIEPRETR